MFRRACKAAKLTGIWFHDLRRSFVTNARRRGVPESVVKMSGHRILTGVTYRQLDYCLEAGGFTVEVPDLPGVITEADSIVEARRLVREAAALWLDVDTARAKAHAR
jgi:predicted RNase H-like HicB family nuclease